MQIVHKLVRHTWYFSWTLFIWGSKFTIHLIQGIQGSAFTTELMDWFTPIVVNLLWTQFLNKFTRHGVHKLCSCISSPNFVNCPIICEHDICSLTSRLQGKKFLHLETIRQWIYTGSRAAPSEGSVVLGISCRKAEALEQIDQYVRRGDEQSLLRWGSKRGREGGWERRRGRFWDERKWGQERGGRAAEDR